MPKLRCIFNGVGIMIAQKARRLIELEAFGIRVPRFAAFTVPCSEDGEISLLKSLYHDRVSEVVATCKEYVIIRPCLQQEDDVKASYAGILDSPIFHKTCIDADGFARIVSSVNGDILNNKRIAEYCKKNKIPFSPPSLFSSVMISETFIAFPFKVFGTPASNVMVISVSLSGAFSGVTLSTNISS